MGELDSLAHDYLQNSERFADLFNFYFNKGEQIIDSTQLQPLDPSVLLNEEMAKIKKNISFKLIRDILKQCIIFTQDEKIYVLLGIENQNKIDYLMPVRIMLYDALCYYHQMQDIKTELRNDGKIESLMHSAPNGTLLNPVVTLVCYWGTDKWDGPRQLKDVVKTSGTVLDSVVSNYKIHVFEPRRIKKKDLELFKTDMRLVWKCFLYSRNKKQLKKMVQEDDSFQSLDGLTVMLLNSSLRLKMKTGNVKDEENVNMCKAWDEILEDEREKGRKEERKNISKEMKLLKNQTKSAGMKYNSVKNRMESMKAENKSMKAENKSMKAENKSMKAENKSMKNKMDTIMAENDSLKAEKDSLKAEKDSLKAEKDSMKAEKDSMKAEIDAWKAMVKALKEDVLLLKKKLELQSNDA